MLKNIKRLMASIASAAAISSLAFAPVGAAASTVVVTPSNNQGWVFNGDPTTQTPYEFNEDQASTGEGSLHVLPIGSNAADKFIAAKSIGAPAADFNSVSYDFLIAGDGTADDDQQFYLNVYTNLEGSSTFYDCRYDYVPIVGSTSSFTTATFTATDTPINVGDRADAFTCPATLAELPEGSTVSFIALNVGDTSTSDEGLAGYLDNAVISVGDDTTTYDFEADPTRLGSKEDCKNGGWRESEDPIYKNQGDCVSSFASQGRAGGNPIQTLLNRFFN